MTTKHRWSFMDGTKCSRCGMSRMRVRCAGFARQRWGWSFVTRDGETVHPAIGSTVPPCDGGP